MSPTIPPSTARWLTLSLTFAAGILVAAVVLTAVPGLGTGPDTPSPDPEAPSTSITSAGPSCDGWSAAQDAGWVHELGLGDARVVTLNATVVHDPGSVVEPAVARFGDANYAIALEATDATEAAVSSCDRVRTRLEVAVTLPAGSDRVVVEEGGETLLEIDRSDSTPVLYRLPDPVNATG